MRQVLFIFLDCMARIFDWLEKPIFKLGAQLFLLAELFKILIATLAVKQIKSYEILSNIISEISWKEFFAMFFYAF